MISGLLVFIFKCQTVDLWRHNTKSQEWVIGESLNVDFYNQWLGCSNWESKEFEWSLHSLRKEPTDSCWEVKDRRSWFWEMSGITLSIKICKSFLSSMKDSLLHFVLISLSLFIAWPENYIKYNTIILMDIISWLKRSTGEHTHIHTKQDSHSSGQGGRRIGSLAERWVIQERGRTLRLKLYLCTWSVSP